MLNQMLGFNTNSPLIESYGKVKNKKCSALLCLFCNAMALYSLQNINQAAEEFLAENADIKIFAFDAPMGAGKTTFTKALVNALGSNDAVSSPTYSLVNEYRTHNNLPIYHIDLYRLTDADEAVRAGIEDALWSGNYCIVEWPSIANEIIPKHARFFSIEVIDEYTRKIVRIN
jgi:tRNA threonylcarbamoyladenosine biosynthesis protein TsaE